MDRMGEDAVSVELDILSTEIMLELALHWGGMYLGNLLPIITNRYEGFTEDDTKEALAYLLQTKQVTKDENNVFSTYRLI